MNTSASWTAAHVSSCVSCRKQSSPVGKHTVGVLSRSLLKTTLVLNTKGQILKAASSCCLLKAANTPIFDSHCSITHLCNLTCATEERFSSRASRRPDFVDLLRLHFILSLSLDSRASATAEWAWPGSICSVQIDAAVVCFHQKYIWHRVDKRPLEEPRSHRNSFLSTELHSVEGGKDEKLVLVKLKR